MSQSLEPEIQSLISTLKERYTIIKSVELTKSDQSGIYLTATDKNENIDYLRFKSDGKLFVHKDGAWRHVKDFLFK